MQKVEIVKCLVPLLFMGGLIGGIMLFFAIKSLAGTIRNYSKRSDNFFPLFKKLSFTAGLIILFVFCATHIKIIPCGEKSKASVETTQNCNCNL